MEVISVIALILSAAAVALIVVLIMLTLHGRRDSGETARELEAVIIPRVSEEIEQSSSRLRRDLSAQTGESVKHMGELLAGSQGSALKYQSERIDRLEKSMSALNESNSAALEQLRRTNEAMLEKNRETLESRLDALEKNNRESFNEMRRTVDERLEKSLEEKMNRSFALVSERLEQVYKGLGEMQNLAVGVGDLKKVLSNVKTRGILGEIQLGSILKEILAPSQYAENVATKKGSSNVVEFAVKLPAQDDGFIWLPIDSKFPGDTYAALRDAADSGDKEALDAAAKALVSRIKSEARDISTKYIDPPRTTEFAIMFLPFEGLYAEAVNRGLVELLQRDYKVNIAGPSTMAALLNSLQMGFKTLAVQKRSAEVWKVLGGVKKEFDTFAEVLERTRKRLDQANHELDDLVGVRTRQIQRQLKDVQTSQFADTDSNQLPE